MWFHSNKNVLFLISAVEEKLLTILSLITFKTELVGFFAVARICTDAVLKIECQYDKLDDTSIICIYKKKKTPWYHHDVVY